MSDLYWTLLKYKKREMRNEEVRKDMSKTKLATSSHNSKVKKGELLSGKNLFLNFQKVLENLRSSLPKLFCKKSVLENFKKFTGKHLCRSSLFK